MKNKSIEEILNHTIKESIQDYEDTEQGNYRTRYELLMLDLVVGRFKTYGHLDEENYKELKYLIWEFLVERGWARNMPEF